MQAGQKAEDERCKLPIQPNQDDRRPNKLYPVYHEIFRKVVEKLCKQQGITGQPAHNLCRTPLIVKGKGKALTMRKQTLAHIPLHSRPQLVPFSIHIISTGCLQRNAQQYHPARQRELPEKEATVQQRFCKIAHQQRNQQRKHRGHKRAE